MAISTKRKAYLALLLLSGAMLGADKLCFGTLAPSNAAAATSGSNGDSPERSAPSADAKAASAPPKNAVSRADDLQPGRLAGALDALLAKNTDAGDLFSTRLVEAVEPPSQPSVEAPPVLVGPAQTFPPLKVTSIMLGSGGGSAVVNRRVIRHGETVDGAMLSRVDSGEVEFTMGPNKLVVQVVRER